MTDFLLKRQRNELFQAIESGGMNPSDFVHTLWAGEWAGFIGSVPTFLYPPDDQRIFAISQADGGTSFSYARRPGTDVQVERGYSVPWREVLQAFGQWVVETRHDMEEPDLWAELAAQRPALTSPQPVDNSPFTPEEQRRLAAQVDRVLDTVLTTLHLTADRASTVRADMDYLKESVYHSGRRDWANMAMGVFFGWILQSILPPNMAAEIWTQFVSILQATGHAVPQILRP